MIKKLKILAFKEPVFKNINSDCKSKKIFLNQTILGCTFSSKRSRKIHG